MINVSTLSDFAAKKMESLLSRRIWRFTPRLYFKHVFKTAFGKSPAQTASAQCLLEVVFSLDGPSLPIPLSLSYI
jgi:hypothetical protein